MNTIHSKIAYNGIVSTKINEFFDLNHLHNVFGHYDFETLKRIAKIHNSTLLGSIEACENFTIAKAMQKSINRA
jgi:hypothetical protein